MLPERCAGSSARYDLSRWVAGLIVALSSTSLPGGGLVAQERFFDWTRLQFPAEDYAYRRALIVRELRRDGGGVWLVPAAPGRSEGDTFRQASDFLYLTGLELPDAILAVDADSDRVILFAPRRDARFENPARPNDFPGRLLADDPGIGERAGLADVRPLDRLDSYVESLVRRNRRIRLRAGARGELGRPPDEPLLDRHPVQGLTEWLRRRWPRARLGNAFDAVARVRMIKSPSEVEVLRRAADATAAALRATAAAIRPGVDERTLQGVFEATCRREGAQRIPFTPIVKSGPNALRPWRILAAHYDRRNRILADGDLVILDVGCEVDFYVSDVGRTFPASGRFSDDQRRAVAMVADVSDSVVVAVHPGVTFEELKRRADAAIPAWARCCMQAGVFFGHHIGLETGDPSLDDAPLAPGMVFTVEPWYYDHARGVAAFIEDVVMVSPTGVEILTGRLPRAPQDLERLVGSPAVDTSPPGG